MTMAPLTGLGRGQPELASRRGVGRGIGGVGPLLATPDRLARITRQIALQWDRWQPTDRSAVRLNVGAPFVEVWVRFWAAAAFDELHDLGGSVGAMTVVRGNLVEWHWVEQHPEPQKLASMTAEEATVCGSGSRRRVLEPGVTVTFPAGHIHDLGCREDAGAVTVQAFSPPLRSWSRYHTAGGVLRRSHAEPVTAVERRSS